MTIRTASWLAAAVLAATAAPAFAQDGPYHPGPPPPLPQADEEAWDEDYAEDAYEDEGAEWREHPVPHRTHQGRGLPPLVVAPAMGYSAAQRGAWLAQCRAAYHDASGRRRGEAIGGVLGAVAGGVAGNRIADGERLGGTLIGAGVGGLAGAAIGGAIGAASDRDEIDACEAYLLRYEQSYDGHGAVPGAHGYGYPYGPVMWVKVPIVTHRHGRDCGCETVVEEWVEEAAPPPVGRAKRVKIRPADKRVRVVK